MDTYNLPTTQQLAKLPLRAVVAYAALAARRVRQVLLGVADEGVVEEAFSMLEQVTHVDDLDGVDVPAIHLICARLAEEAAHLQGRPQRAASAMYFAVSTASGLLGVVLFPDDASRYANLAVDEAARTAKRVVAALDDPLAAAAANAARKDYEALLKRCGEHDTVVIGEPISLSDASFSNGSA